MTEQVGVDPREKKSLAWYKKYKRASCTGPWGIDDFGTTGARYSRFFGERARNGRKAGSKNASTHIEE